ncbi:MAG TPA: DUF2189 domain-containing protein [Pseudolabrys sp.]|jgi:uncharacterized membrane protein|nr:DUF2189 domain-containing protein [Pseudolabrys sp.]
MARSHVLIGAADTTATPAVRHLEIKDLKDALRKGWADFSEMPSHAIFLCVIYPVVGIILAQLTFGFAMLPFLFPLAAGFALLGPVAALGLYEMSRRREAGLQTDASHALDVLYSPSIGAIVTLGVLLMLLFFTWLAVAHGIYVAEFGYAMPSSFGQFMHDVFMTRAGWELIIIGNVVGFVFAAVTLVISAVSFPLLLDRDVGAAVALHTSIRVVLDNPRVMAAWGLIVAVLLVLGSLPFFIGLAVVMPVLGHATWHLYRKAVDAEQCPPAKFRNPSPRRRYAADFPTSLFG